MSRKEILIGGVGGQGVVLSGILLGTAATLFEGKKAVQTQSYSSELTFQAEIRREPVEPCLIQLSHTDHYGAWNTDGPGRGAELGRDRAGDDDGRPAVEGENSTRRLDSLRRRAAGALHQPIETARKGSEGVRLYGLSSEEGNDGVVGRIDDEGCGEVDLRLIGPDIGLGPCRIDLVGEVRDGIVPPTEVLSQSRQIALGGLDGGAGDAPGRHGLHDVTILRDDCDEANED